jgi:hypothetical protein
MDASGHGRPEWNEVREKTCPYCGRTPIGKDTMISGQIDDFSNRIKDESPLGYIALSAYSNTSQLKLLIPLIL